MSDFNTESADIDMPSLYNSELRRVAAVCANLFLITRNNVVFCVSLPRRWLWQSEGGRHTKMVEREREESLHAKEGI